MSLIELLRFSKEDWVPLSIAFVCLTVAAIAQAFIPHLTGEAGWCARECPRSALPLPGGSLFFLAAVI